MMKIGRILLATGHWSPEGVKRKDCRIPEGKMCGMDEEGLRNDCMCKKGIGAGL
jgi:hypothetical protein